MSEYVLVIDDDEDIRDIIAMALGRRGWQVATAANGLEALAILGHRAAPSLILLDLRMPGMSGGELMEALRTMPGLNSVPVVVMSGDASERMQARSMGARDFIAKPMELAELADAVNRWAR
jgi:CheY-like chemotaxis protein